MSQQLFETERLIVRQLSLSDHGTFHDLQSNPSVMQYTGQAPMNEEESLADLQHVIAHYSDASSGFRVWGVYLKNSGENIGTGALISEKGQHEIGFRLREDFWKMGYGKELAQGLLEYGFDQLQFDKIFAEVDEQNEGSIKILDKVLDCIRKFHNPETDTDDYYYELTRNEYEKRRHSYGS
ncbi:MAG: GNAT family N-acetyltransferase [Crocinitomicaceae bacterium]|nr:GNAT family N-acetyltransferase [Crocinitomicaceae bacterium]